MLIQVSYSARAGLIFLFVFNRFARSLNTMQRYEIIFIYTKKINPYSAGRAMLIREYVALTEQVVSFKTRILRCPSLNTLQRYNFILTCASLYRFF